ncbi:MAG: transcription antitermination factor NusB [Syntrophus sp. (in: bacteria)]|nr:transcription antitermination factor NusB [Syntrophus sp. (in: bacteria)]
METNSEDTVRALARYCESFPYQQEVIDYTKDVLTGIEREKGAIDGFIKDACDNWRLDRITYVDINILRLGIYEMLFSEDVPPKVAIDEAIEIAKKYGNEDSREFINGVLDRVLKDFYKREKQAGSKGQ